MGTGFVLVHRAELQQLLAAELGSSAIHLGARCTSIQDGSQAVTARFADGREVQADVLIGADGVHSAVRARLFGPAVLRYRGYTVVRSVTPAGSVPLPRDGSETWRRGARFGLGPTSGERIIWYATWNAAAGGQKARWRNAAITTLMARQMGSMGQWEGRVACAVRDAMTRAMPLSLQLRQLDLVVGARKNTRPVGEFARAALR